MIVIYSRAGASISLRIDDARCNELLDYISARFVLPNAEFDRRYELSMQSAAARLAAAQIPKKIDKRKQRE